MADDTLRIIITAEDGASKPLSVVKSGIKATGDQAEKSAPSLKNLNQAFQDLTGVNLTGVGAIMAIGGALKYSIDQAFEGERAMAATEAVIRSTGGAAGLTAQQVSEMANSEKVLTGIADEVIQSGMNMLLTFKNIGGETIPRATQAMEDMAAAMAGGDISALDLKGTAIQLGKALNDPIDGISALTRVGVTFTDQQKEAIQQMVSMGDVAGAQAIILAELESEFGGMAEAMGETNQGKIMKFRTEIDDLAESIGSKLIPILGDAAGAINTFIGWNDTITSVTSKHRDEVVKTSKSYSEYVAEITRAEANIPGLLGAHLRGVALLTEAQYNERREVQSLAASMGQYAERQDAVGQAQLRLAAVMKSDVYAKAQDSFEKLAASHTKNVEKGTQEILDAADKFDQRMDELKGKHLERESGLYDELSKLNADYNASVQEDAIKLSEKLGELSDAHLEKENASKARLAQINADYNEKTEEAARQLNERLGQMAEQLAERQRALKEQIGDLESGFTDAQVDRQERTQDELDRLNKSRETKRQELNEAIGKAMAHGMSSWQMEQAQAALAAYDAETAEAEAKIRAKADKEDARAQAEYDKRLKRLQEQLARELAAYNEQTDKLKAEAERQKAKEAADHAEKLIELQTALDKENAEYAKQTAKLSAEAEKQKIASAKAHEEKVSELSASLAKENAEYIKQTETIEGEYSKQRKKLRDHLVEVEATYTESLDKAKEAVIKSGLSLQAIDMMIAASEAQARAAAAAVIGNIGGESKKGGLPGFASGGMVPGPMGMPQLVVVHGGETVVPAGGGGGGFGGLTFVYAPTISLADEVEAQARIAPVLDRWWRGVNGRRG